MLAYEGDERMIVKLSGIDFFARILLGGVLSPILLLIALFLEVLKKWL